jgi:hypothetical protein
LILVAIVLLSWWLWPRKADTPSTEELSEGAVQEATETLSEKSQATPGSANRRASVDRSQPAAEGSAASDAVRLYVENSLADPEYEGKQPINFYGRVVDENEQPVEGATVDFKWTDLSPNGTSEYHTVSDASGLFSMVNQRGKRLSVTASKPGYYSAGDARQASFEYANPADGLFRPDPNRPVILHLRKKGTGTELVTSQYGMKPYFGVTMPLDGSRVYVDLVERKTGATGPIKVSQNKPPVEEWKQAAEWSFRMEIPDGGFVEQNDEFPFEAPENGYQPVIEFDFQKGEANWADGVKKDFYIKFGNPPRYGRLRLETLIDMAGARFTYAINPDGSRYLEPKAD